MRADRRRALAFAGALALATALYACADGTPVDPAGPPAPLPGIPASALLLQCDADVQAAQITCAEPNNLAKGANANRIIGGQDLYVKLTSEGTAHDPESGIFRSEVRVQNLTGETLGTADGDSIDGVRVFFHEGPTATGGSGPVEVENADGEDVFTESAQPYFLYPEILPPMEGTQPREWRFLLGPEVTSFTFMVYVAAEVLEADAILIDAIWSGAGASNSWLDPQNWQEGVAPDTAISIAIPPAAQLAGSRQPQLQSNFRVEHLRVGAGSTLDLNGHNLRVYGSIDAAGEVVGGTVLLHTFGAIIGGSLPSMVALATSSLHSPLTVSGPLRISGGLTTDGQPLTISAP